MGRHHRGRPGEPQGDVYEMIERFNAAHRPRLPDERLPVDPAEETVPDILEKQREIMRMWDW